MPSLRKVTERQQPFSTAGQNLFAAVEMRSRRSINCELTSRKELKAMIDIYTAAVCANLRRPTPKLLVDIRKGLARLTAGLVLIYCVYGNLS